MSTRPSSPEPKSDNRSSILLSAGETPVWVNKEDTNDYSVLQIISDL